MGRYRLPVSLQVFFIWKNTKDDDRRLVYALKPSPKQPAAYARVPGGAQAAWDALSLIHI